MPSSPGIGMHVEARDPDDHVILSRIYSSEGKITFTSHAPGEHVICMYSNSTAWFSGSELRVHLEILTGDHAVDYAHVAQKEKMSELQLRIRQLLDQVDQVQKEQNYQRVSGVELWHNRIGSNVWDNVRIVPRGALPTDQREHKPARAVVVAGADGHPGRHGRVADAPSEAVLRGQEAGVSARGDADEWEGDGS